MYCSSENCCNNLIYHNQIASYEYFWTGHGEKSNFHHASFKDLLTEEFNSPFYGKNNFNNRDLTFNITISEHFLPEYRSVKINLNNCDEDKGSLYFSIPSITQEGTFLINNSERAFILNLIESPGLIFNEGEALVRPCPYGHALRFFRDIPCEYRDVFKDEIFIKTGCVEFKGRCFITPVFLFLTGTGDREIMDLYHIDKDILFRIKELYVYENNSFKENLREDLVYLLDPHDLKGFKLLRDDEILSEFRQEFSERFFIGKSGRWQINRRFKYYGLACPSDGNLLTVDDIKGLLHIFVNKNPQKDDRYCLSNNTVLQTGDYLHYLVLNEFRKNRHVFKKFSSNIVNFNGFIIFLQHKFLPYLEHSVREFFISSPLSHVLTDNDKLSLRTWQKKLARIDGRKRDVHLHHSYYGRICPLDIEEVPVFSLTEHARINEAGILETPYLKVHNNEITDELIFLTPDEEDNLDKYIASGTDREDKSIKNEQVFARGAKGKFLKVHREEIGYIDYSPSQIFSITPLMIPFLSGSDFISMLKQSMPLKYKEEPFIYTEMEERGVDFIHGVNLFCVFVSHEEYGTVLSESASRKLTSIHFCGKLSFSTDDTMIFTGDNPFYSEEELKNLDERGLIRTGTYVKSGDILFSSVREKEDFKEWMRDFSFSPFTDKALCYEDLSEHVPHSISGMVTGVIKQDNLIEIEILDERPACEGDRIISRHGFNSIISRVLPDKEMIFYKDGRKKIPVDIIINYSTCNHGQTLETIFGFAAKKLNGRFKIESSGKSSFSSSNKVKEILKNDIYKKPEELLNLSGLKNKINLYNPLNLNKFEPSLAGYQYIIKPLKEEQRTGFHGTSMVFDMNKELSSLKFDDMNITEGLLLNELKKCNSVDIKAFIYYIRGLGINVIFYDEHQCPITYNIVFDLSCPSDINRVIFQIATDEDIMLWSSGEVKHGATWYSKELAEIEHGLYSGHIFGEWRKNKESSSYLKIDRIKALQTRMAYIKLPCRVIHPMFNNTINIIPVIPFYYRPLLQIDNKIVPHDLNRHYEKILTVKYQIERYEDNRQERKNRKVREFLEKELFTSIHNLFNNEKNPYRDRHTGNIYKSFITLLNEMFIKEVSPVINEEISVQRNNCMKHLTSVEYFYNIFTKERPVISREEK
jgi:DNA-directed RNA polymerase beta subunit